MVKNIDWKSIIYRDIKLFFYEIGIQSMGNYPESLVLTFQATMGFFASRVIFFINRFGFQSKIQLFLIFLFFLFK